VSPQLTKTKALPRRGLGQRAPQGDQGSTESHPTGLLVAALQC